MNLSHIIADRPPPPGLSPQAAATWRELALQVVIHVEDGSAFAAAWGERSEELTRDLLAGFGRVCVLVSAVQASVAAGLGAPALGPKDVELLVMFGLRPKWMFH